MDAQSVFSRSLGAGRQDRESGYTLLGVMFLLALFSLWLSVAVPRISRQIQRDKELECLNRGRQYARAIRLFYRHSGNFPTNIEQLDNTDSLRFLRKRYRDPVTNSDWKLVYQGDVKPDMLDHGRQFFGVPFLASSAPLPPGVIAPAATTSPFSFDASDRGAEGSQTIDPASKQVSPPAGASAQLDGGVESTVFGDTSGGVNPAIGNRGIVGVSSHSTKRSILIYRRQTHYSDWQFIYDPASDGIVGGLHAGVSGPISPADPSTTGQTSLLPAQ